MNKVLNSAFTAPSCVFALHAFVAAAAACCIHKMAQQLLYKKALISLHIQERSVHKSRLKAARNLLYAASNEALADALLLRAPQRFIGPFRVCEIEGECCSLRAIDGYATCLLCLTATTQQVADRTAAHCGCTRTAHFPDLSRQLY